MAGPPSGSAYNVLGAGPVTESDIPPSPRSYRLPATPTRPSMPGANPRGQRAVLALSDAVRGVL